MKCPECKTELIRRNINKDGTGFIGDICLKDNLWLQAYEEHCKEGHSLFAFHKNYWKCWWCGFRKNKTKEEKIRYPGLYN